jgi:hypothetical protein
MIALDAQGRHFAMTTHDKADYAYIADGMEIPALVPRATFEGYWCAINVGGFG